MNDLLETLLEEAFAIIKQARNHIYRIYEFPKTENMIKVAILMIRTGKTFFFTKQSIIY